MSLPSKRPLGDQNDLSSRALIRRDAESTDSTPPPSPIPPPPKRPRTSPPATVCPTDPTPITGASSPPPIPTPISLIHRSFASAQTYTYTRLSFAEMRRLPADSVAAYAHALQRALDITARGFNEKITSQETAHGVAEEMRKVNNAVYGLLNVPVRDLEREVERVAEIAYDVSNDLESPVWAELERIEVNRRLDFKAKFGPSLFRTSSFLEPLGRWHDEREVRRMRSKVCTSVLEQLRWRPELRNKEQTGRWRYFGCACSRRHLLEMLGLENFRGAQWAPAPFRRQDDPDDDLDDDLDNDAGSWRCKSLPLAKWKETMGYLENEIPGEGTLTVRGPSICLYFSPETFEYRFCGQYGL